MSEQLSLQFFTQEDVDSVKENFDALPELGSAISLLGFMSESEYIDNAPVLAAYVATTKLNFAALLYGFGALIASGDEAQNINRDDLNSLVLGYALMYSRAVLNIMDKGDLTFEDFVISDFVNNPPTLLDSDGVRYTISELAHEIEEEANNIFSTQIFDETISDDTIDAAIERAYNERQREE